MVAVKRLEISFFDGQKSEAPGHFDASKQKEKPLRGTQELCYPAVLETFIFVEDAGWPVYGIGSLSVREGGRS